MLITVEGCIAAGKTTVATGLAAFRDSALLLEDFEMNPFLREFYRNPKENATETEFGFLLVHFHQLRKRTEEVRREEVVSDFHLGKDLLFAEMNMADQEELQLFRQLSVLCAKRVPKPDVVIFLSAPSSLICERVYARNRDFEQQIAPSYFERLCTKYEEFYEQYAGLKLKVPMADWDFVGNPELFSPLSLMIDDQTAIVRARNG